MNWQFWKRKAAKKAQPRYISLTLAAALRQSEQENINTGSSHSEEASDDNTSGQRKGQDTDTHH